MVKLLQVTATKPKRRPEHEKHLRPVAAADNSESNEEDTRNSKGSLKLLCLILAGLGIGHLSFLRGFHFFGSFYMPISDETKTKESKHGDSDLGNLTHHHYHHESPMGNHMQNAPSIRHILDTTKDLRSAPFLGLPPPNVKFLTSYHRLTRQLTENYALDTVCPQEYHGFFCAGIGSTMGFFEFQISKAMLEDGIIYSNIDETKCRWAREDTARNCTSVFGDCYLPAKRINVTSLGMSDSTRTCNNVTWFVQEWGKPLFSLSVTSWLLGQQYTTGSGQGGDQESEQQLSLFESSQGLTNEEPFDDHCIALNVRRGDACVNPKRACFDYQYYMDSSLLLKDMYQVDGVAIMTDAHDFPFQDYQQRFSNVHANFEYNRSIFNVDHLKGKEFHEYVPEKRNIWNTTAGRGGGKNGLVAAFFQELASAARCNVMVGTFSAGVSRLLFALMLTRHGRVPPFVSLEGCPKNVWEVDYRDTCRPGAPTFPKMK